MSILKEGNYCFFDETSVKTFNRIMACLNLNVKGVDMVIWKALSIQQVNKKLTCFNVTIVK